MEGHGEAAADVITGGVIARAVEPAAGEAHDQKVMATAVIAALSLTGAYCSNCGQAAHLHRSLVSLGHDILHGVFHFEGKVWRTLPELFFRPGRLTRRYIDGERAKFVSPMALYLFAVFLMFAVFPFTSDSSLSLPEGADVLGIGEQWKENIEPTIEQLNEQIEAQQERLNESDLTAAERTKAQEDLAGLIAAREAMEAMVSGDLEQDGGVHGKAGGARQGRKPRRRVPAGTVKDAQEPLRNRYRAGHEQSRAAALQAQDRGLQIFLGADSVERAVHVAVVLLAAGHPSSTTTPSSSPTRSAS